MKRIIPEELLNSVASYLAGKPFIEVQQLITQLGQLPEYEEPKKEVEKK